MSEELREYNGWKNYPTWSIHLWISNEEGDYNEFLDSARATVGDLNRAEILEKCLRRYVLRGRGNTASCYADILGWARHYVTNYSVTNYKAVKWALDQVDYAEIISALDDALTDGA